MSNLSQVSGKFRRAGRRWAYALLLLLLLAQVGPSCGEDAPPEPEPAPAVEAPPPSEPKAPVPPPLGTVGLDELGNLEDSGEGYLGFPLPTGSLPLGEFRGARRYTIRASRERVVRFYRSRGFRMTRAGRLRVFEHDLRTLRHVESPDERIEAAKLELKLGPGAGCTLRILPGEQPAPPPPAIVELVEAERELAAKEKKGDDGADAAPGEADPSQDRARVEQLRHKALERKLDPTRSRDISRDVYDWLKADPSRKLME